MVVSTRAILFLGLGGTVCVDTDARLHTHFEDITADIKAGSR